MNRLFAPLAVLLFCTVALAQSTTELEAAAWALRILGSNPVLLGVFVFGAIASWKRQADKSGKTYSPWFWRGWALGFALAGTAILYLSGAGAQLPLFHAVGLLAVVFFALVAGITAIWGRDGLKTVMAWLTVGLASALGGAQTTPNSGIAQDDHGTTAATLQGGTTNG